MIEQSLFDIDSPEAIEALLKAISMIVFSL